MKRYRYMVVRYPRETAEQMGIHNDRLKNHLPIHELLSSYHATRLDDEFVVLSGNYPVGHHNHLANHEHVLMLPSISSGKTVKHHAMLRGKHSHGNALLTHLKLSDDATVSDIVEELEAQKGPLFSSIR